MRDLFHSADNSAAVFRVDVKNPLFDAVLTRVPELPAFEFLFVAFVFAEDSHQQGAHCGVLDWFVWIVKVLQSHCIELSFVYVRHLIVLFSNTRRNRRFQCVLEAQRVLPTKILLIQLFNHFHSSNSNSKYELTTWGYEWAFRGFQAIDHWRVVDVDCSPSHLVHASTKADPCRSNTVNTVPYIPYHTEEE